MSIVPRLREFSVATGFAVAPYFGTLSETLGLSRKGAKLAKNSFFPLRALRLCVRIKASNLMSRCLARAGAEMLFQIA